MRSTLGLWKKVAYERCSIRLSDSWKVGSIGEQERLIQSQLMKHSAAFEGS